MIETLHVRARIRAGLEAGPLGSYVDGFVDVLMREGYARGVVRRYLRAVERFARWLRARRISPHRIDERVVARFVAALVAYLRVRGPVPEARAVFLRGHAPVGAITPATVTAIAQQALARAGVTTVRAGAHAFRYTVATHLVRSGASFKAVADVLGHARLETTAIYAKLDVAALAGVALPWPGAPS